MSKHLEPGTTIPDFELPDENGETHRLSELQGDNILVLHLSRGEHCPRERQHHRELLRFHELCPVAFTELVTIMPNDQHDVFRLKAATGAHWTFLSDEQLEVQRHFDINEYTDTHHDYAGVPHTLVLAPGLVVDKAYVGYWFWGRPSTDQLWLDLQDLTRRIKDDYDPTTPAARRAYEQSQAAAAAS
jgi:peroxiredoxin